MYHPGPRSSRSGRGVCAAKRAGTLLLPCEPSRIDLEEFRGCQKGLPASAVARKECFLFKLDTKLVPQLWGVTLFQVPISLSNNLTVWRRSPIQSAVHSACAAIAA